MQNNFDRLNCLNNYRLRSAVLYKNYKKNLWVPQNQSCMKPPVAVNREVTAETVDN